MKIAKEKRGMLEIIIASILFGIIPIIVRLSKDTNAINLAFARVSFAFISLAFFRVLFSSLTLFSASKIGNNFNIEKIRKQKLNIILFGIFHATTMLTYFFAITLIDVATAVILLYTGAIYIVIFSWLFLREKIEKTTIISLLVAFIGLIAVINPFGSVFSSNIFGYIMGILSGIFMALVFVLGKVLRKDYGSYTMTFYQNIISVPILLPLLFISTPMLTISNLLEFILIGVVCTGIAFVILYQGMKYVKAQKVGILLMLEVVIPIILAVIFFSEIPNLTTIIGGLLILTGFLFVTR